MSFADRLARLRAVANHGTMEVTPAHGIIDRADLLELLRDWERLDGEIRRTSSNLAVVTKDAWERTCRALHWRTAELKVNGIEPMQLADDMPQYPPDNYQFPKPSMFDLSSVDFQVLSEEIRRRGWRLVPGPHAKLIEQGFATGWWPELSLSDVEEGKSE